MRDHCGALNPDVLDKGFHLIIAFGRDPALLMNLAAVLMPPLHHFFFSLGSNDEITICPKIPAPYFLVLLSEALH